MTLRDQRQAKAMGAGRQDGEGKSDGPQRKSQSFAFGSLLNLFGAGVNGLFTFLLAIVLTRRTGQSEVGAFMMGVGALTIAAQAAQLGANTGLVRFIPLLEHREQSGLVRPLLIRVLTTVGLAGVVVGLGLFFLGPITARILGPEGSSGEGLDFVRAMAILVPFMAVFLVAVQGTQGFSTMTPSLVVDKIVRPIVQVLLVGVFATSGVLALTLGYGVIFPVGICVVIVMLWRLSRSYATINRRVGPSGPPMREFWAFSLPRCLSTTFQVGIMWADTILIGFMLSAEDAAVYAVATRFLAVGGLVVAAILQAMNPRLARHLVSGDIERAEMLYQRGTKWVVAAVWPLYLLVAIYAPSLLQIFGAEYQDGATALRIVAVAMMLSGAFGAVDSVLLMGGRSWLSVGNWGVGLLVNVGLNLVLIPRIGIEGAAIAWLASIVVRNVIPAIQIHLIYKMQPVTRDYLRVVVGSLIFIGLPSAAAVWWLGQQWSAVLVGVLPGGAIYALLLWRSLRRDPARA